MTDKNIPDHPSFREDELPRKITAWGLTANIINIVVGAGIFVLPAAVGLNMGAESIVAYLFCGILLLLVMLCFAEIGSKVTIAGGPYAYIHEAFGDAAGFVTAILFLISTLTADAAVANVLFGVITSLVPALNIGYIRILFFVLIFGGVGYLNVRGVKEGIGMVKFTTIAKLIPLLLFVIIGSFSLSADNLVWVDTPNITDLASVSLLLFFAFQGSESALPVTGEVINPRKSIPKAIFISLAVILSLYMLIQLVTQGILGDELRRYTESPLAEAAYRFAGPVGFTILIIGAAVSMFGNLSGELLNIPRVLYGLARDGILPAKSLARIHPRFKTPYLAVITYSLAGCLLAVAGGFQSMAIASSVTILLIYLGIAASVIKFRKSHPEVEGFTIPGGFTIPILTSLVIIWFISGLSRQELIVGGIMLAAVVLLYFVIKIIRRKL